MSVPKSILVSDPRHQRGMHIAATATLRRTGDLWAVPSQSGDDPYTVDLSGDFPRCSCPDHLMRRVKCTHIHAVEYTIRRETAPDGATTVSKTVRVTYKQDWPSYNAAQTNEAERLPELLHGLCQGIVQPPQTKGRPRLSRADVVFAVVLKVYGAMSGRRAAGGRPDRLPRQGLPVARTALQQHLQLPGRPRPDAHPQGAHRRERQPAQGRRDGVRGGRQRRHHEQV